MSERIPLYHGTSFDLIGGAVANGKEPLIGKRLHTYRDLSGTLTNEKIFAGVIWFDRVSGRPTFQRYRTRRLLMA